MTHIDKLSVLIYESDLLPHKCRKQWHMALLGDNKSWEFISSTIIWIQYLGNSAFCKSATWNTVLTLKVSEMKIVDFAKSVDPGEVPHHQPLIWKYAICPLLFEFSIQYSGFWNFADIIFFIYFIAFQGLNSTMLWDIKLSLAVNLHYYILETILLNIHSWCIY